MSKAKAEAKVPATDGQGAAGGPAGAGMSGGGGPRRSAGRRSAPTGGAPAAAPIACALKFLTPAPLASAIIGRGGSGIDALRSSCQAKVSLTEHGEYFAKTESRILTVQTDDFERMHEVVRHLVGKAADAAAKSTAVDAKKAVGAKDELCLEVLVPHATSKRSIKGAVGASAEVKLSVSAPAGRDPEADQPVAVSGSAAAVEAALVDLAARVQALSTQEWFRAWLSATSTGSVGSSADPDSPGAPASRAWESSVAAAPGAAARGAPTSWAPRIAPPRRDAATGVSAPPRGGGGAAARSPPGGAPAPWTWEGPGDWGAGGDVWQGHTTGSEGLDGLLRVARALPSSVLDESRGFSLRCVVPHDIVGGLIGRSGAGIREVQKATGTTIETRGLTDDSFGRTMTITGPLPNACAAYMLMMQRYIDVEQAAG